MKIKLRTIALLLLLGAAAAIAFVQFGVYNVAATEQHTAPVYRLLEYAMRQSVKWRADTITVPDLTDEGRVRNGLAHYRQHCLQCHGAPGVAPDRFALSMMPAPANLVTTARQWRPAELFWVIRTGIKMSGMPAWEYRLSERELWDVVAFVARLPMLSPREYAAWSAQVATPQQAEAVATSPLHGDARAGKRALHQYLCATCHQIPGVTGADKHVGPPLNGIATRKYLGGVVPNTPENMVSWLQDPQRFDPLSAMPNLSVTERDARDISAFLATLEDLD